MSRYIKNHREKTIGTDFFHQRTPPLSHPLEPPLQSCRAVLATKLFDKDGSLLISLRTLPVSSPTLKKGERGTNIFEKAPVNKFFLPYLQLEMVLYISRHGPPLSPRPGNPNVYFVFLCEHTQENHNTALESGPKFMTTTWA